MTAEPSVISIQPHERVVIVVVTRRVLDAMTAGKLETEVSAAAAQAPGQPLVLDLSKVEFAPSAALGTLLRLAKDFKFFGRRLIIVGVGRQVRGTLAVTGIDKLFEIRESVAAALAVLVPTP